MGQLSEYRGLISTAVLQCLSLPSLPSHILIKFEKKKMPLKMRDTGRGFLTTPSGTITTGPRGQLVQDAWVEPGTAKKLREAFANGLEGDSTKTLWDGKKGSKYANFRLDRQSRSNGETRFAFQEFKAVHGQVHLVEANIPKEITDKTKMFHLYGAMRECLTRTGTIWEIYYEK